MNLVIEHDRAMPYTTIPNSILCDERRLTWKAKAIYAYLLGRPPGWTVRMADLVSRSKDGRDAVVSAFAELEQFGYIRRRQSKDSLGRFSTTLITVVMPSVIYEKRESPLTAFPYTDNPATENPLPENPRHSNLDPRKLDNTNLEGIAAAPPRAQCTIFPCQPGSFEHFVQKFAAEWNAMAACGAIAIIGNPPTLNAKRMTAAKKTWKASSVFRESWHAALWQIPNLPDYTGTNRSGWKIDATHFLRPGIVEEILERAKRSAVTSSHSRTAAGGFTI